MIFAAQNSSMSFIFLSIARATTSSMLRLLVRKRSSVTLKLFSKHSPNS